MSNVATKVLPAGWQLCKLGDVMRLKNGHAYKSKDYSESGTPLIRISDLKEGVVNLGKAVYIPDELVNEDFLVENGDLLIAMSGATTGKIGVYKGDSPALQNQRVGNFKIINEAVVDKKYRDYYISSLRKAIEGAAYGGAQPNISSKGIEEFVFPLAPPKQQKRIVAKIEELFSHIDAGIEALKKTKQLLKQYRQSVLKAAVTGELTKEWREINNLSQENWQETILGEIAQVQTGKTPNRSTEEFWVNGTIPWLTSSATNEAFTHHADQFVTQTAVDSGLKLFDPGTLLLAMYGEGKTRGQVTEITFQTTCNQACAAIIVNENKASRAFVRLRLNENYEQTRKAASGGNQPNLNLSKVREISLPVPSLAEQSEIVFQVERKFEMINRLENGLEIQLLKAEKNKQSILASAFSGCLLRKNI